MVRRNWRKTSEEPRQVLPGVLPREGLGGGLASFLEGKNIRFEIEQRVEGVRPQELTLENREEDLDLVELTRVNGGDDATRWLAAPEQLRTAHVPGAR